jgi:hypothetical protein
MKDTQKTGHLDDGSQVGVYLKQLESNFELEPTAPIELHWDDITPAPSDDAIAASQVIDCLLGPLRAAVLKLQLPDHEASWAAVERCALPFALANRSGETRVTPDSAKARLGNIAWRRSWTPGTRSAWVGLLGESPTGLAEAGKAWAQRIGRSLDSADDVADHLVHESTNGGLYGQDHAIFVNPHRARRPHGSEHVVPLMSLWLGRYMQDHGLEDVDVREDFLEAVRVWVDELVQNVRGHATGHSGPAVTSFVRAEVLSDTGDEGPRLLLAVQDTGPGIPQTARPKLSDSRSDLSDQDLVAQLLQGNLGPWHRARGIGLPNVTDACRRHGASLAILSGGVRVTIDPGREEPERHPDAHGVSGTAVIVTVPLPR